MFKILWTPDILLSLLTLQESDHFDHMIVLQSEVAKLVAERVNQEREAFEIELQNQLRRQVGVHTEHLRGWSSPLSLESP